MQGSEAPSDFPNTLSHKVWKGRYIEYNFMQFKQFAAICILGML